MSADGGGAPGTPAAAPPRSAAGPEHRDPRRRLERKVREAEARMRDHPELDGEGIQLALEHEWALMDLARATENPEGPRHGDAYVRPREIAAG